VLIKGVSLGHARLHRIVEEAGGYVVAEDDWRGSRAAGDRNVRTDMDPATAIFEKYFYDETSPRVQPSCERDAWFHREVSSGYVDGVLFYIPLEDDVVGWDYPRQSAWLDRNNVPSIVIRDIAASAEMSAFLQRIRRQ
jgi:benzoyl-CoA reductase/2-hydroxyglutaryl-CoA dehydratase subunit BcrC/BadD/HgdB